jgi:Protein of unknown function VcgC/VcgE (DUF2780)
MTLLAICAPPNQSPRKGDFEMSDLVNELTTRTGISPDLVQKGLGALLSFLKKELGEETFDKLQSSIPDASRLTSHYESSSESAPAQGGLFEMVSGLAAKLLGGQAGAGADLLSMFSKLGFKPEQIEAFLPKALELIKTYLSPELLQKIVAALPAIAKFVVPEAKQGA